MRYVLDTHILLWSIYEPHKIKPPVRKLLEAASEISVCMVSLWEIIVKASLGKYPLPDDFLDQLQKTDTRILGISLDALRIVWQMPHHHRDPFDRLIIAQAQCENLTLVTCDRRLEVYQDATKIILA